ncbi:hypothetical protein, conserved [Leishmania tarentolae]|uniref:Uncharacterized protein n=1 Tax=Leishmania tarentolae TaxID=5689 RepID=A0A640KSK7_LEITA|nr:hypothetical protein, conserved [Leishmania tarentolae]
MPTKEEAVAHRTKRFANQRPRGDVPCWLRRSYTRTIPKDIRTIHQLQRSFEDIREQWRDLCKAYTHARAKSYGEVESATEERVPHGTFNAVEGLVSQLKSVKQELLSHLSRLSDTVVMPSAPLRNEASTFQQPTWATDLMGRSDTSSARRARAEPHSEAMQGYLQAVWLARRVWAWSLCFAIVQMDLELLSGSVSVAAELFFGNVLDTATASVPGKAHCATSNTLVLHSTYNMGGSISDTLLYATVAEALGAEASWESRSGDVSVPLADSNVPPHIGAKLDEEACEVAAFFGYSVSAASYIANTKGMPSTHTDPHAAVTEAQGLTPLPETFSLPPVRDLFWVHAVALWYSVMVRDDTRAARLLSIFETAKRLFSVEETEGSTEGTELLSPISEKAAEQPHPLQQSSVMQAATVFVLLAAKLLLDEDYSGVQQLLLRAGFSGSDDRCDEGGVRDCLGPLLANLCPQGVLLRFLFRLLAEHVVRRKWIENGVGQAFRPVEPVHVDADGAAARPGGGKALNPHRLACVLANSASTDDTAEHFLPVSGTRTWSLFEGTHHLCAALQMAALSKMGGDWPLPPALLTNAFA